MRRRQLTGEGCCRVLDDDRRVGRALRLQNPEAYQAVLLGGEVMIVVGAEKLDEREETIQ